MADRSFWDNPTNLYGVLEDDVDISQTDMDISQKDSDISQNDVDFDQFVHQNAYTSEPDDTPVTASATQLSNFSDDGTSANETSGPPMTTDDGYFNETIDEEAAANGMGGTPMSADESDFNSVHHQPDIVDDSAENQPEAPFEDECEVKTPTVYNMNDETVFSSDQRYQQDIVHNWVPAILAQMDPPEDYHAKKPRLTAVLVNNKLVYGSDGKVLRDFKDILPLKIELHPRPLLLLYWSRRDSRISIIRDIVPRMKCTPKEMKTIQNRLDSAYDEACHQVAAFDWRNTARTYGEHEFPVQEYRIAQFLTKDGCKYNTTWKVDTVNEKLISPLGPAKYKSNDAARPSASMYPQLLPMTSFNTQGDHQVGDHVRLAVYNLERARFRAQHLSLQHFSQLLNKDSVHDARADAKENLAQGWKKGDFVGWYKDRVLKALPDWSAVKTYCKVPDVLIDFEWEIQIKRERQAVQSSGDDEDDDGDDGDDDGGNEDGGDDRSDAPGCSTKKPKKSNLKKGPATVSRKRKTTS